VAEEEGLAGKAESIAVDKLSSAVSEAVKEVSSKHGLRMGNNLVFQPGTLIGRQVMEAISDLDAAQKLASDVAAHVQKAGLAGGAKLSPGVLMQGGRIIVGYFPVEQVFEVAGAGG
jgi:hypothetical protein